MSNYKFFLQTSALGHELGLIKKIRFYCKLKHYGQVNFNVRAEFSHTDKYHIYTAKKLGNLWSSFRDAKHKEPSDSENDKKHFEIDKDMEHYISSVSTVESEYVFKCWDINIYRNCCDILKENVSLFFGFDCEAEYYSDIEVPYSEDELKVAKLQNELEKKLERLNDLSRRAERSLCDIIYGKWVRKEIKDYESLEQVMSNPHVAKAIAEINIVKNKIRKFETPLNKTAEQ